MRHPILIAEIKTHSPFGFKSHKTWSQLFELAENYGDMISIHTDERWGGSFDLLQKARQLTDKPILAKGIHANDEDIAKSIKLGANMVLVVGRIPKPSLIKYCLLEPTDINQLSEFKKVIDKEQKIAWNSRNLSNGQPSDVSFQEARQVWAGWMCQASNIKSTDDVFKSADAVLVGENLESYTKSL
jgi:indole-3-glycerol phosphate synthase